MRTIHIALILCLSIGVASCDSGNTTSESSTSKPAAPAGPVQSKLSEAGTGKLVGVLGKYYALKNALVATKAPDANAAATALATEAESVQAFLAADSTATTNLKPYLDTIITQSKTLAAINDETCEKQRITFEGISSAFYNMLKQAELKNARVYHQYCPMAFNDKGAFWLSDESEIRNPYFGKKMMECGEVTDSL